MGTFRIDSVAFIGRTLDEYTRMMDLDMEALKGSRVLDCPGGACSFTAEARAAGVEAVAADTLYGARPEELEKKCSAELDRVVRALNPVAKDYCWDFYGTVDGLVERRRLAYGRFIEDYSKNNERYVRVTLPELPFATGEFDIVLSAHLLFLYGDRLGYAFHLAALKELARVASGEVRVFPVLGLDSAESPHLANAIVDLEKAGLSTEICPVPFEFQRGGDKLLKIIK